MITFTRSYQTADGQCFATLEEAQYVEVAKLLSLDVEDANEKAILTRITSQSAELVNILTLSDSSRPKARGVRKPRKAKVAPEQLPGLKSVA